MSMTCEKESRQRKLLWPTGISIHNEKGIHVHWGALGRIGDALDQDWVALPFDFDKGRLAIKR